MRTFSMAIVLGILGVACGTSTTQGFGDDNNGGTGDGSSGANGSSGATGSSGTVGSSGSSGSSGTSGSSGSSGQPAAGTPPPSTLTLAQSVTITEVAMFQAVKIDLETSGTKVANRNAPVVVGRDGFVRVYVGGASGKSLTGELRIKAGGTWQPTISNTATISGSSSDQTLSSTFNFDVPAAAITDDAQYLVDIVDTTASAVPLTGNAVYPSSGTPDALGAEKSGPVKIMIVPVQYGADGSNRVPDTSAAQLAAYTQQVLSIYPATDVQVTVRSSPYAYKSAISANGNGWSQILDSITSLRQSDGVADDVYYFGAFEPAASFDSFCGGGCVTGLSGVDDQASDAELRASVGIGYTGSESAITVAHEVGHAHGREHSPCGGAADPDPAYPYSGGIIGVWGYDSTAKTLIAPTTGTDIMGYCDNIWISDFVYSALFTRIQYVNSGAEMVGGFEKVRTFRFVDVAPDGSLTMGQTIALKREPAGPAHAATLTDANGNVVSTASAHYYKYDHIPGGFFLVQDNDAASTLVIDGHSVTK